MTMTDAEKQMAWKLVHGMLVSARALASSLVSSIDSGLNVVAHLHEDRRPEGPYFCCACTALAPSYTESFRVGPYSLSLCESCAKKTRCVISLSETGRTEVVPFPPLVKHP